MFFDYLMLFSSSVLHIRKFFFVILHIKIAVTCPFHKVYYQGRM